jgi:hypothetical protein
MMKSQLLGRRDGGQNHNYENDGHRDQESRLLISAVDIVLRFSPWNIAR